MALIRPDGNRIKGRDSRGRFVSDTPHSGVIFARQAEFTERKGKRGSARRKVRRTGTELSLSIKSEDPWMYNVRADTILEHVFTALLIHHRANVIAGTKADGSGSQPDLDRDTLYTGGSGDNLRLDQRGRKSLHRGYKTGFFADTIRMSRITGSTSTANVRMLPHVHRNVFVATEAARGVEYFYVEGDADRVIQEAVLQAFDAAIDGDIRLKPAHPSGVEARRAG